MKLRAIYNRQDGTRGETVPLQVKNGEITAARVQVELPAEEFPYGDFNYLDMDCAVEIYIDGIGAIEGYMADYRMSEFWCAPFFGKEWSDVPPDTQCLIYQKKDGIFGVLFPVCGAEYKCTLEGGPSGLVAKVYSWCYGKNSCNTPAFLFAEGADPFVLLEKCAEFGLALLGNFALPRKKRSYPELFEYLGWCSWDAMQIRVSTAGLLEKCREFKEKNVPVKWAILDDMWAEVAGLNAAHYDSFDEMVDIMHKSRLWSFSSDPARFPDGLGDCIAKMKEYGLAVGVWHPTTGYWRGLDPDGPAVKTCPDALFETGDGRIVHHWSYEKAYRFYDTFHQYLQNSGVDFLKIDNQSFIRGYYKGFVPTGEAARNIHSAIERSVDEKFKGRLINCMGMASENMWNRPRSAISRCSDDFLPENKEWFNKHILQCSYNSLVQGQFLWCDWDMWWTDDAQGVKNSVLRAISGGPVYVSDQIGRTKKELLEPLCFSDGRILRCDGPAVPTADCICVDPRSSKKPFKLWNRVGECGIVAVFNLSETSVSGRILPADFGGKGRYAVYGHFSKKLRPCEEEGVEIKLASGDDYELYIFAPVRDGFAVIGDGKKFISPKAVARREGRKVTLAEPGELVIYEEER